MVMRKIIATTTLALCAGTALFAQLKPTKLSVFNNGTFFEKKEGSLRFSNAKTAIDLPGDILKGTLWLAGDKAQVKQIDIRIDTVKKDKEAVFLDDFLQANQGKSVTLRFKQYVGLAGNFPLRTVSGTLLHFFETSGLIQLKTTEGKILLISVADLSDADFEASANDVFKADTLIRRATIYLDKPTDNLPVAQVTMQSGLQWQPSYYIKLENDKEARIIMKATVENITENAFEDVDLDLVVGAPQMHYGTELETISQLEAPTFMWDYQPTGNFRRYYQRENTIVFYDGDQEQNQWGTGGGLMPPGMGTYSVTSTSVNGDIAYEAAPVANYSAVEIADVKATKKGKKNKNFSGYINTMPGVLSNAEQAIDITANKDYSAEGKKTADLYYYKAGKVDIPKDNKTVIPVSQNTIPFKHVYECNIGDITNYTAYLTIIAPESKVIDVFHSIKLTNKTAAPITEASVFVVNEKEVPMAQDKIDYTPVNDEVSIKLAKAIDVSVKTKEEEQGKEVKAKKFNKKSYDKVTLKGTLELANFLNTDITLNLKKALRGEVTQPNGGTVTKPGRFTAINPISFVKWDVELKAGEKKTITYEYEVYVNPQ